MSMFVIWCRSLLVLLLLVAGVVANGKGRTHDGVLFRMNLNISLDIMNHGYVTLVRASRDGSR